MKELFLDKSLVTNPNVTGELVLVYIALRKVMSDEVPLFSKETSVGIVSLNKMAFVLTGLCTEYDSNLLSILKQGIAELASGRLIWIKIYWFRGIKSIRLKLVYFWNITRIRCLNIMQKI